MSKNKVSHVENSELKQKKVKKDKAEDFNDNVVRAFDDILDSDEKIVKAMKPSKPKLYWASVFTFILPMFIFAVFVVIVTLVPGAEPMDTDSAIIMCSVFGGVFISLTILSLWFTALHYKNTYYAFTNKRLIIRTGIFGVDYKSLDIKNISASDVYVSLLDKLLKKNTGSLRFGSNSSPINGQNGLGFGFPNVKAPYELYKEIKSHIEKIQKESK